MKQLNLPSSPRFCSSCGAALSKGAKFCASCGAAAPQLLPTTPTSKPTLSKPAKRSPASAAPTPATLSQARVRPKRKGLSCLSTLLIITLIGSCAGGSWLVHWLQDEPPDIAEILGSSVPTTVGSNAETPSDNDDTGIQPITDLATNLQAVIPPELANLPVTRGELLITTPIQTATGGQIMTSDGLTLTVPPNSLDHDREIKIYAAQATMPNLTLNIPGAELSDGSVGRVWVIDPGPEEELHPEAIEIAIEAPAAQLQGEQATLAIPAISTDGKRWSLPSYEQRDGKLVFQTRHLSEIAFFSWTIRWAFIGKAVAIGLPLMALGYIVYNRADELPECCSADAPYTSLEADARGWALRWSHLIPGKDEQAYRQKIETIMSAYDEGEGKSGVIRLTKELYQAKLNLLVPDEVRTAEAALVMASTYLNQRHFRSPGSIMTVYVVPSIPRESASYFNPWLGRPYTLISKSWDRDTLYSSVLHELFHFYQSSYVWVERKCDTPTMEASAMLLEREARDYYAQQGITIWTDIANLDTLRNGLDGPACDTLSDNQLALITHGYGLSWFIEYLRDERYSGDKQGFHGALLQFWANNKVNALHDSLVWAAGGSDGELGAALEDFAERYALNGMPSNQQPYALKYGMPMFHTPYAEGSLDFGTSIYTTIEETQIKPWSIQFFELKPPPGAHATLVIQAPAAWLDIASGCTIYLRQSAQDDQIVRFDALQPDDHGMIVLPFSDHPYNLYIVNAGMESSQAHMQLYALEPPSQVGAGIENGKLTVSWIAPALFEKHPELVKEYEIYISDQTKPVAKVSADSTSIEIDVPPGLPPDIVQVRMTMIDGSLAEHESEKSNPYDMQHTVEDPCANLPPDYVPTSPFDPCANIKPADQ